MLKRMIMVASVFGALALPSIAAPITPSDAVTMLEQSGSENVELSWLSDDVARIDASLNGYLYSVRMIDCGVVSGCDAAIVFATFSMSGFPDADMYKRVNEYNDTKPFGRAFLLDTDEAEEGYVVGVDYALDLENETSLDATDMEKFVEVLETFVSHMSESDDE